MAEIVRQETDGGRLIVRFYLGVAYGDIEGFRDHHRAAAARRIDKFAPGLVKEYLLQYHNEQVRESMRGSRFPMGSIEPSQKQADPVPRGPNAFQRSLRWHVRHETGDGRNIVVFLIGVMDGSITGFKPHHRLEAAKELASHITTPSVAPAEAGTQKRDNQSVVPAKAGTQRGGDGRGSHTPSPSTGEGRGEGDSPAVATNSETQKRATPSVVPAKAGTQRGGDGRGSHTPSPSTGEGRGEGDSPAVATKPETQKRATPSVVPAKAGTQRGGDGLGFDTPSPSTGEGRGEGDSPAPGGVDHPPITIEELERFDFTREHAALYNFARDEITGGIYGYDELGPFIAGEEGEIHHIDPSRVAGYERLVRSSSVDLEPSATRSGRGRRGSRPSQANNRNPKTRTSPHPRTLNRRRKNLNTPPDYSKPQAYSVRPEPVEGPPGRSPPKIWV